MIKRSRYLSNKYPKGLSQQEVDDICYDSKKVATFIFEYALSHLNAKGNSRKRDLYRIFFYDCPPAQYKGHNPISKVAYDSTKTKEYLFRTALHIELKKLRKVALRFGKITNTSWTYKNRVIQDLLKGRKKLEDITENDVEPSFRQKGVDMKIGIDISSLTLKKLVKQIILIAGDADFVPAAKLARREGIDFILDPMGIDINPELFEHIDGLQSPKKDLIWIPKENRQNKSKSNDSK
ncbi:NYN domain-containing protein [Ignatzschineria larvae DSM 13226]|uniref:NYN domain-containing protein n=1 Tax=Ignatzschineria larvae DSM 13226 TaxID=1111732 RepID=A0ABZ3C1Z1_9GAMM|nr:NYN domain-containing protein [Ignatzschineria larvae]